MVALRWSSEAVLSLDSVHGSQRHGRLRSAVSLWLTDAYPCAKEPERKRGTVVFFVDLADSHADINTFSPSPFRSRVPLVYLYLAVFWCLESRDRSQTWFVVVAAHRKLLPQSGNKFNCSPQLEKKKASEHHWAV